MGIFYWVAGCILALAWLSRIIDAAIGMPSVADISLPKWGRTPANPPRISIIVPARNEEENIEQPLRTLLALDYPNYEVISVNDRSTDRTGEIMDSIAASAEARCKLHVLHIRELPEGWLGKAHAMWTAGKQATGDWLLFTDADVFFKADSVRRAVAYAQSESADHVVLFPRMILKTVGEKMMIAFFQSIFVFGHRPWKVANPKTKDHIGVGAFNLIRRSTYDAVGTYEALRFEVLDDMKLGKVVKTAGFAQRNVFGHDLISLRWGHGAMGIVDNVTKNFFAVMSFQIWRMLASCFAMAFLNLLPFWGLIFVHGWARVPYAVAMFGLFSIYVGMSTKSEVPPYYFVLHPVSTLLFLYAMLRSMILTLRQGGVIWRGTKYSLAELKKGLV
jgi:glycosyltransferase involved in cell wall biosynthesis